MIGYDYIAFEEKKLIRMVEFFVSLGIPKILLVHLGFVFLGLNLMAILLPWDV